MSIIIGGLGLLYAYNQQVLAFEAVRLAEWTALKDFRELCQEQAAPTSQLNAKCELALRDPFPEPPYVNFDSERAKWRRGGIHRTSTIHPSTLPPWSNGIGVPKSTYTTLYGWMVAFVAGLLIMHTYRRLRRSLGRPLRYHLKSKGEFWNKINHDRVSTVQLLQFQSYGRVIHQFA
ncbi:hypothetical protein OEA41_007940 [Lepraria neglecta]|uniref:Uncharacterized protein n=1 Tax=Lepraria neglecta TaxID=209136 RepID=A0AAD9ZDT0_9LECA|nr:hypothetical protein OEA41_007940 [Lepraria neglecta]